MIIDQKKCPCCGNIVKTYRRKLHSGMVIQLATAHKIFGQEWFKARDLPKMTGCSGSADMAKLADWGLMERSPSKPLENNVPASSYRVNDSGVLFLTGRYRVPKYMIYTPNMKPFFDTNDCKHMLLVNDLIESFDFHGVIKD